MVSWFANGSLRARMAALLVVVLVLPLGLVTWLDWHQARDHLVAGLQQLLQARGDQVVREIDSFHQAHRTSADRIARLQPVRAFCSAAAEGAPETGPRDNSEAIVQDLLAAHAAGDANLRGAGLLDRAGRVTMGTEAALVGVDLSDRPHVRAAAQGAAVISELHLATPQVAEQPSIAYMAPVLGFDGQPVCVVALWVRAAAFWQALKPYDGLAGPGSHAVVLDALGIRIAHTAGDDEALWRPTGPLEPPEVEALVAQRRFGERTAELLQDMRAAPALYERARASAPAPGAFSAGALPPAAGAPGLETPGSHYSVARRATAVPWTVFYNAPAAQLDAGLAELRKDRLLLLLAIIVPAYGVGLLFVHSIVRPVRALAGMATAVASGNLAARIARPGADELGRLALSFNTMASRIQTEAADLQRAHDEMEARFQARTAELQRANHKLEAQAANRRLAEQAIQEGQLLLEAIVDNSTAVIFVKDMKSRYLMVNRRFRELAHRDEAAILGKTDHELYPADVADSFRANDQRAMAATQALMEEELLPQDDGAHTYLVVKCPLRDRDGRIYGLCGIATDITERKHTEQRLQAQIERLKLLDQITCAIGERQDLRSIYQVAIRSLEERLPVDFACVCHYAAADNALTVSRVGAESQALAAELSLGEHARIEIDSNGLARCVRGELVVEPDIAASPFPFPQRLARGGMGSLVAAPLQSESHVFGILVVARSRADAFSPDDCEFVRQLSAHVALAAQQAQLYQALQQAYDDLRQTQQTFMQQERLRALGQMASGIAHDINNAISPARLYAEGLLEREPGLSERARGSLETIARAIDDVAATVARLREFSRQREPQLALAPVDLNRLVLQVAELTRARWSDIPQQRGAVIRLHTDLAPVLPPVLGIESELREALTNLVFNAVDAMPEGGMLTLRTAAVPAQQGPGHALEGPVVQVEVADSGVGMDDDTRRRCLEPFFTTKGERGTGLGLAMVYGIVQRHGADIRIDSTVGLGTTVRLRFPLPAGVPAVPPAGLLPALSAEPGRRLRILLIDDDPLLLKSLCDTLEADGHVVAAANGGQAGIDAFAAAQRQGMPFEVVITDLGMPYVDGRKVARAVKQHNSTTPVILLTGWGQRLVADSEIPEHVDQVLGKPPKLREVRTALAHSVRQMEERDAAASHEAG
jgi:PAS domain S-box-containing protein